MAEEDLHLLRFDFFEAVARADITSLKQILSTREVDLEARDPVGRTALHLAVIAAPVDVCQYLIDHGARLDAWTEQGEAVVHLAAKRGDVDVLRAIMDSLEAKQPGIQGQSNSDGKKDRTVHVNCLAQKHRLSPLYIAVALAHVEIVEALLTTYHADPNIIVGQIDIQRGTQTAHALEAALQHPRDICRSLLRMLLQHGASLLDPSTQNVTMSLLVLAMKREEDALDIFAELDSQNFLHAITKVLWTESMRCQSALTCAIQLGLQDTAFKLLSYGAPPQLDFDSSLEIHAQFPRFGKSALEAAKDDFWQPILSAAQHEMPRLVVELLDRGADPKSTITDQQARILIYHRDCRSVLDLVEAKLAELRSWRKENETINYDIKGTPEESKQLTGKENAIVQLIKEYEEAEAKLVSVGAEVTDGVNLLGPPSPTPLRTHKKVQLHAPSSKETHAEALQASHSTPKEIDFRKLETVEDGHAALFTACRDNNIPLVKTLTLGRWGVDLQFPPISISEVSGYSKSPFLVAVESKNFDLARTIVQIATVQHIDFVDDETRNLCSALADDRHSIDSIKSVSAQVKSTASAKKIVLESSACFAAEKQKDIEMLRFSIEIESSFTLEQSDIDRHTRHAWVLVERGDWPDAFEEYAKATGAPFQHVASQGKLKGKKQLDRLQQLSPLLKAAWSGNLNMVRFFLDKDKTMAAYRYFAAHNDFTTRKAGPEQSQAEFLGAVEDWIGNRDNLVLHCAVLSGNIDLVKFVLSAHPEFLEVKSIDGWTPLLTAALRQRVEALHILLEAGASPFATDLLGRNMLHLILVNPGRGYLAEPEKLSLFLRSMDRSVLHKLLERRCAESPGGLTPFARWISVRPEPNTLFTTLLELSNTTMLEMLDGGGHTPLHTVANLSMANCICPLIEKASHVMFYEGTNGKTPYDLLIEKQLHGFLECLMPSYTRSKKYLTSSPLIHWPLFAFGTDFKGLLQPRDPYGTWEICQDMVKSQQHPRKLVARTERIEIAQLSKDKKIQKNPKGDQHDVVSLVVYKPGNICW